MIKTTVFVVGLTLLVGVSGCTALPYKPTVDLSMTWKRDNALLPTDYAECEQLAAGHMDTSALAWGVSGAMVGAGMGAMAGAASEGILFPAVTTGVVGGAATGAALVALPVAAMGMFLEQDAYESAFRTCMRGRGYAVVR